MRNTTIKRYSGIESLRLLAMLGIVICHWGDCLKTHSSQNVS